MISVVTDRARALARWIKHYPDRRAHQGRRAALVARLTLSGPPSIVLVVCLGNICRSPYGAGRLRALLAGRIPAVDSAGFIGPGRPSPDVAQGRAALRDLNLAAHRSRLIDSKDVDAGLILVMDRNQQRTLIARGAAPDRVVLLGDLDPTPIATRAVPDPYGRDADVFDAVFSRIDRCCLTLVDLWYPQNQPDSARGHP